MPVRFRTTRQIFAAIVAVFLSVAVPLHARPQQAAARVAGNCVSIGTPKPHLSFTYRYSDSAGGASEFTDRWEELTATGSKVLTNKRSAKGPGSITSVNQHHVMDDVFVLDSTTQSGTDAGVSVNNSSSYQPGVVAEPAYRACLGRTWPVAAVNVTNQSAQGRFSAATDPGTLTIKAIHESVTVPAGSFDTVHYLRTMRSASGQAVDEYWKSIEHGVTVKRTHTLPGVGLVTTILQAVK